MEEERPVKVAVMEGAVQQMERLVATFHRQCVDMELKDRHIAALQQQLHSITAAASTHRPSSPSGAPPLPPALYPSLPLPPSTFSFLCRLDCTATLSAFIRPLVSLLVIRFPGYWLMDANAQHEVETGWTPSLICNKSLAWSLSTDELKADISPLVKKIEQPTGEGGRVRLKRVHQYPGSTRVLKQLFEGRIQKADMLWRFYRPDGFLYETPCTAFLAAGESRHEGSGALIVEPARYACFATAASEAIRVEEPQVEGGGYPLTALQPHLRTGQGGQLDVPVLSQAG